MHSILLVDDHKIMRDGLRAILARANEFEVVAEAETGPDAILLARRLRPRLVLMDIHLPGLSGIEATEEILRHVPEARVVMLSMYDDERSVMEAMRAGARAFVLKTASDHDLLDALRAVAQGGSYFSPEVSDKFLQRLRRGSAAAQPAGSRLAGLTPRELQVMRFIAEGKSSKDIAAVLELSVETVRGYRKTMMKKLGVSNIAALTQLAYAHGLTSAGLHSAGAGIA